MRTDGLKVKPLLFLPHQPADRTASSGLSPRLIPPPEGWAEAAGGNNTASVQTDKDWLIDWVSNPGWSTYIWEVGINFAPHLPVEENHT